MTRRLRKSVLGDVSTDTDSRLLLLLLLLLHHGTASASGASGQGTPQVERMSTESRWPWKQSTGRRTRRGATERRGKWNLQGASRRCRRPQ